MYQTNHPTSKDIQELIIARLEVLPEDIGISIGTAGEFSRDEMIEKVRLGDEIGQKIIAVELNYLRSLKNLTNSLPDILTD